MGLLSNWLGKTKGIDYYEEPGYKSSNIGTIEIPDRLTDKNCFTLANTVTEIYQPIDFYADRGSKLRRFIADKYGNEIPNSEYNRFLTDINPLYSLSDLYYQYIFSYLADGNGITYVNVPKSYKTVSANTISRLDVLQPDLVEIDEYTNISPLNIKSLNELIKRIRYSQLVGAYEVLDLNRVRIDTIDQTRKQYSLVLAKSPIYKAKRSVDNLLATYSARYNVYANNGAAGYLVKKQNNSGNLSEIVDPATRESILKDINDRNGITGKRNFWGISSVPMEFINTLAHIKDLMPFEETLEDSIKIASVFQIPSELVPRKDQTTFNNKSEAERSVWENGLMSMIDTADYNFTLALYLDKVGLQIKSDYSSVSALSNNETVEEDLKAKKLANLKTILELNPENADARKQIDLIVLSYGKG